MHTSDNWNISHYPNSQNNAISVVQQGGNGQTLQVSIDIWRAQGSRDDGWPILEAQAMFFGKEAKRLLNNFQPGDPIQIIGDARIQINDNGYIEAKIWNASWRYIPRAKGSNQGGANAGNGGGGQPQTTQPAPANNGGAPSNQQQGSNQGSRRPPASSPSGGGANDSPPRPQR